ncbi:NAD(P)/FAD-dependent oxidoreductase [Sandaracinus amylolyticus]|uniref:Sarcosine oxidase beta subunit n=1 Tax=Sandaracinus amylolyticus TaxID=927083 RepID=A0A0F6SE07_9BACT|nr:FAD-binding oxidoreductase [Sandaracinus amylolyticus]AKF04364.1 Sarcosine oxidase beta subunit [Sandaracinus amylolyticus]
MSAHFEPIAAPPKPLPDRADVVIVGGGIMGLAIAWNLARLGQERIVVVEKSYLCSGASGRNGGGVRAQWSSETNVRLMKRSIELCSDFATKMRINVWFRRGGYLFLARSDERAKQLEESARLQRDHGLPTRIVDRAEMKEIVPELDVSRFVAASWNPHDGVVFPWPFVWGYARACEKLGVALHTHTDVSAIETTNGRVSGVVTSRGRVATQRVLVCAGAWSPEITRMVGVDLPSHPHRHEICSSEPLKPFLRPLVGDLADGLYFSQSMRGEIVGGISNAKVPDGIDQRSSLRFLGLYSRALARAMPVLGEVKILRQWAGCYDITPDGNPLVGDVDEMPGMYLMSGFMGHGFMMAPVMGELFARWLLHGEERELFERWNLRRYRLGKLLSETMILG